IAARRVLSAEASPVARSSRPSTVDGLIGVARCGRDAAEAGQEAGRGYGGGVGASDGTIWKVATSSKKAPAPPPGRFDGIVLLLGVAGVAASKRFFVDRGGTVARGFCRSTEAAAPTELKAR